MVDAVVDTACFVAHWSVMRCRGDELFVILRYWDVKTTSIILILNVFIYFACSSLVLYCIIDSFRPWKPPIPFALPFWPMRVEHTDIEILYLVPAWDDLAHSKTEGEWLTTVKTGIEFLAWNICLVIHISINFNISYWQGRCRSSILSNLSYRLDLIPKVNIHL